MRHRFRLLALFKFFVFPVTLLLSTLSFDPTARAQAADPGAVASPETLFQQGLEAFQKNDLKKARASFEGALTQDAFNANTLFNLGLVEQRDGHPGRALGYWRKALAVQPGFAQAMNAIEWQQGKLERSQIPHEVELWENLRSNALVLVSLEACLGLVALLLLATGWLVLGYVGRRRRALLDELPLPAFPFMTSVMTLLLASSVVFTIAKMMDLDETRATIIAKKIEARSTPESVGTPLFDLFEGLEVIVRQTRGDWVQVSYPGGSTGWVPRNVVLATSTH